MRYPTQIKKLAVEASLALVIRDYPAIETVLSKIYRIAEKMESPKRKAQ